MDVAGGLWGITVWGGLGLACVSAFVYFCHGYSAKQPRRSTKLKLGRQSEMKAKNLYQAPQLYEKYRWEVAPPESRKLAKTEKHSLATQDLQESIPQDLQEEVLQQPRKEVLREPREEVSNDLLEVACTWAASPEQQPQETGETPATISDYQDTGQRAQVLAESWKEVQEPAKSCEEVQEPVRPCKEAKKPAESWEEVQEPAESCKEMQEQAKSCEEAQEPARSYKEVQEPARSYEEVHGTAAGSEHEMACPSSSQSIDNFCWEQMTLGARLLNSRDLEGAMNHFTCALNLYSSPEALYKRLQDVLTPEQLNDPCMKTQAVLTVYLTYLIDVLLHEEPNTNENTKI